MIYYAPTILEEAGIGSSTAILATTGISPINTISETGIFWLYEAFGVIGLIFYCVVPETKGRSLEGIEADMMGSSDAGEEAPRTSS